MLHLFEDGGDPAADAVLAAMFEARKRVFVDLLGWDVPVLAGRFEVDQFDDPHARYLVLTDSNGRHLGSARLLDTTRPHILGELYPELCEDEVPSGPGIAEITRFCLDRRLRARERLMVRNQLVSALVDHALAAGIQRYTGVAEMGWLQQILSFGWICRPLGLPQTIDGTLLGALAIEIGPDTPSLLARAGIYQPVATVIGERRHAA
ncbi:acyl-homoserine-lactone synthase [Sphingosinithalassobacter sp. CS137]|uniref:acyl-homoserine-lactone synthase n=1 Tax=Sphingosinithalassobacter sp. CS137 TaxID=2762748 RepID=UPI00165E1461|nr:acyl-homoserine-lactone synthase [Sphingosinithalassobacter sp. CS137]